MVNPTLKKESGANAEYRPVLEVLQSNLLDQILMSLQVKQAHWNIVGPRFISIHEFLDLIYGTLQEQIDQSAERIRHLRAFPNGDARLIAKNELLEPMPAGEISDIEVVDLITHRLEVVIDAFRKRLQTIEEVDVVTSDMIHGHIEKLEAHGWMMRSNIKETKPKISPATIDAGLISF
jgi:starvation-inducible DNA-binding protein